MATAPLFDTSVEELEQIQRSRFTVELLHPVNMEMHGTMSRFFGGWKDNSLTPQSVDGLFGNKASGIERSLQTQSRLMNTDGIRGAFLGRNSRSLDYTS